eukprot:jgi/Mesvir1/779/Mv17378-RA.1
MADDREEAEDMPVDRGEKAEQNKALESITDHVEEKQLDASRVQEALKRLRQAEEGNRMAQLQRERELAAVRINTEDVDVMVAELQLDRKVAERTLREHNGDAVAAIRSFLV